MEQDQITHGQEMSEAHVTTGTIYQVYAIRVQVYLQTSSSVKSQHTTMETCLRTDNRKQRAP